MEPCREGFPELELCETKEKKRGGIKKKNKGEGDLVFHRAQE